MAKLLYIEVSPRDDRSTSTQVAKEFLSRYEKHHSSDTVEHLNLWTASLPRFDGPALYAKYAIMYGQSHTQEQKDAWKAVEKVIAHFNYAGPMSSHFSRITFGCGSAALGTMRASIAPRSAQFPARRLCTSYRGHSDPASVGAG
jgi:flavodoxin-like protein